MQVAVWPCLPLLLGLWCSLGLVPSYVVLVLGNEGGGPHHMQDCHTQVLWIGFKKLVVLTLNFHQIFNWDFKKNPWYLCLAQRLVWIYIFYINHIAICMCNSSKCWFKHPLPYIGQWGLQTKTCKALLHSWKSLCLSCGTSFLIGVPHTKTHSMRYIEIKNKMQYEVHQCKYVVHMSCGTTIVVVGVHLNIHSYVIHAKACDT